jgi:hypothetical protein
MVDWETIEIEYVTTDISHRKLAEKYNVCRSTVCKKAAAEKWSEKREKHRAKLVSKAVNAVGNKQAERAAKLVTVSDLLLDKIKSLLEGNPELLVNPQNMKHISGVLKDIKDIQMIKSEADMREQEARIKKLQSEVESGDKDQNIHVTIGSELAEYAQ